ncbi:MAG: hypothetical protein HYX78_10155 [Armatimonadetes bacterium]|nr:hypothetical protein [Armatimonadota bacterium]
MSIVIRAHFDGRVIVPDEPVDLPVNQPIELEVRQGRSAEREAAWQRLLSSRIEGLNISEESLERENLYEDRL